MNTVMIYFLTFITLLIIIVIFMTLLKFIFKKEIKNINNNKLYKFECLQCGSCCKKNVQISNQEIKDIDKANPKISNFYYSFLGLKFIKHSHQYCCFLEMKDKAYCSIYQNRPKACQKYPFCDYVLFKGLDEDCKGKKKITEVNP